MFYHRHCCSALQTTRADLLVFPFILILKRQNRRWWLNKYSFILITFHRLFVWWISAANQRFKKIDLTFPTTTVWHSRCMKLKLNLRYSVYCNRSGMPCRTYLSSYAYFRSLSIFLYINWSSSWLLSSLIYLHNSDDRSSNDFVDDVIKNVEDLRC